MVKVSIFSQGAQTMPRPSQTERVLIVTASDVRERDRRLTVYGPTVGRLIVQARSVRTLTSKQAAILQPLMEVDALIIRSSDSPFGIIAQPHLVSTFGDLAIDPRSAPYAYALAEILLHIPPAMSSDLELYDRTITLFESWSTVLREGTFHTEAGVRGLSDHLRWLSTHLGYGLPPRETSLPDLLRHLEGQTESTFQSARSLGIL